MSPHQKKALTKSLLPATEHALYKSIRDLIITARSTVARGIDLVQVHTNFEIGRHIVAHEQRGKARAEYGQEVLKRLAENLTAEFGRGFSKSNLEYMRRFFLTYQDRGQIAQTQIGQLPPATSSQQPFCLSWTHYIFLMGIKNPDERRFYEIEAQVQNWNIQELRRQFNSTRLRSTEYGGSYGGSRLDLGSYGGSRLDLVHLLHHPIKHAPGLVPLTGEVETSKRAP